MVLLTSDDIRKYDTACDRLRNVDKVTHVGVINELGRLVAGGFNGDALTELERLDKARDADSENKLNFKTAYFENDIYSVI